MNVENDGLFDYLMKYFGKIACESEKIVNLFTFRVNSEKIRNFLWYFGFIFSETLLCGSEKNCEFIHFFGKNVLTLVYHLFITSKIRKT